MDAQNPEESAGIVDGRWNGDDEGPPLLRLWSGGVGDAQGATPHDGGGPTPYTARGQQVPRSLQPVHP